MDTKKVFLDTNIIIDLLCHREHCAEAATVVNMGIEGKVLLYCSSLTIANCIYSCRKTLGKEKTTQLLKLLCDFIKIAPCGQTEVDSSFLHDCEDFEDTLQYFYFYLTRPLLLGEAPLKGLLVDLKENNKKVIEESRR
ncbi:MAG: PIN domain-containing protein [Prevotella sp.]|nr:PIN domain-containing protein [Prevotella sp.]